MMTDFLQALYRVNGDPLHLIVDEADLLAPQRLPKDMLRLLGAMDDVVHRGRAHGLGVTLITQRPVDCRLMPGSRKSAGPQTHGRLLARFIIASSFASKRSGFDLQPTHVVSLELNSLKIGAHLVVGTVSDVYLLALHEPYHAPEHRVPINATIVHARTLLHPLVLQPDGGRMYRCLTEFPGRTPGCLIPLSTLTFELDGGGLWPLIGDWERVVEDIVSLARNRDCDAMPLGLPQLQAALLGGGPSMVHEVHDTNGTRFQVGPAEREQHLNELSGHVHRFAADGPFWPGDNLGAPPREPGTMPYRPYRF